MRVHTLDLQFQGVPQVIAAYLVEGPAGAVLVETGPGATLPVLRDQLRRHGLAPPDLAAVLVTHIHLDHAGAAGWFARQGVPIYVHAAGAPHLIDPGRLLASAGRIYGDQMDALWGEMLPAPSERVIAVDDGQTIAVAGLVFTALDTPGHAGHHHALQVGDLAFTGDIAGVRLPGSAWVDVPAPPPEFDLARWQRSLDRLRAARLRALYPTHFGLVTAVEPHLALMSATLEAIAAFVRVRLEDGLSREALVQAYVAWLRDAATGHGIAPATFEQYATANPPYMSVDGIARYWRKQGRRAEDERSRPGGQ